MAAARHPESPDVQPVTGQTRSVKAGGVASSAVLTITELAQEFDITPRAIRFYEELLAKKVAPELARGVLPQSMYTEFIETGSLAAYVSNGRLAV